jgi:hypothetical protein
VGDFGRMAAIFTPHFRPDIAHLMHAVASGHRSLEGTIGVWSNVAPDGSALFNRNLSTDEIYALDLELP